jgi:hypothetical protein
VCLQAVTNDVVQTGEDLLAISRRLQPKLEQLRLMAANVKALRQAVDANPVMADPRQQQQQQKP